VLHEFAGKAQLVGHDGSFAPLFNPSAGRRKGARRLLHGGRDAFTLRSREARRGRGSA